jgi:hypothetical protein
VFFTFCSPFSIWFYFFVHTGLSLIGAVVVYDPMPLARYLSNKSPSNGQ